MQALRSIPPLAAILFLGFFLSVASLWYIRIQPTCRYVCEGGPCPRRAGVCGAYIPYAGFPLYVFHDNTGGSPLSSVGKIQPDDITSLNAPHWVANILFYSSVLWFFYEVGLVLWLRRDPNLLFRRVPIPLITLAGAVVFIVIQLQSSIPTVEWMDEAAIQGEWELIEPAHEAGLRLSFDGQGNVPTLGDGGKYRWYASNQIEIWISAWVPDFCTTAPFFLQSNCNTTLIPAGAYPAPGETIFPELPYPYPAQGLELPTPIPTATPDPNAEPIYNSYAAAAFTVRFDGETLILTPITATPLIFRRVAVP